MPRIGIYPGTFDPIHIGHIVFAQKTLQQLQLNEVVFLPESQPRGKHDVTPRGGRMWQIEKALQGDTTLRAIELESSPFTVQKTLPDLQKIFPNSQLTLLIGSDIVQGLENWPDIEKLLATSLLAIGMRTGALRSDISEMIRKLEKQHDLRISHDFIDTPHAHVASSQLRQNKHK